MIDVRDLSKVFGVGPMAVVAADSLNFTVGRGEVFGLLGPNGAGKTTTLRMLLGLLPPSRGDALIDGFSVFQNAAQTRGRLGLVSASAGLYQWLTPRETLAYFADLYDLTPQRARERITHLAAVFGIEPILDRRCSTLSTGQKQRVNLARALVHDPPIMLLDEPTRGLDVVGSRIIFDYIDWLSTEDKAVIVSTHRLDEAERLCDRFGLLHQGRIKYSGTLADLQDQTGQTHLADMFFRLLDREDARRDADERSDYADKSDQRSRTAAVDRNQFRKS